MEKTLRVLGAEDEGHSHSHSHSHAAPIDAHASGVSAAPEANGLKSRKPQKADGQSETAQDEKEADAVSHSSKLSAYLNLFGDFVHNM